MRPSKVGIIIIASDEHPILVSSLMPTCHRQNRTSLFQHAVPWPALTHLTKICTLHQKVWNGLLIDRRGLSWYLRHHRWNLGYIRRRYLPSGSRICIIQHQRKHPPAQHQRIIQSTVHSTSYTPVFNSQKPIVKSNFVSRTSIGPKCSSSSSPSPPPPSRLSPASMQLYLQIP